jgi:hypothetical protein
MSIIKRMMYPLRLKLGRFVILPDKLRSISPIHQMTLLEKVAAFITAEKVPGDYLEFGVYRGDGMVRAYRALKAAFDGRTAENDPNSSPEDIRERRAIWESMRFFAFDSFQGLPELQGIDATSKDFHAGQYSAGIDLVRSRIEQQGVPKERVICVPGWFDQSCTSQTLADHKISKAAVVHIDCDLYHSAKSALAFLEPILQDGTVLIFDDWFAFRGHPHRGEQRAFAEWKETLGNRFTFSEYHREGYSRICFILSDNTLE